MKNSKHRINLFPILVVLIGSILIGTIFFLSVHRQDKHKDKNNDNGFFDIWTNFYVMEKDRQEKALSSLDPDAYDIYTQLLNITDRQFAHKIFEGEFSDLSSNQVIAMQFVHFLDWRFLQKFDPRTILSDESVKSYISKCQSLRPVENLTNEEIIYLGKTYRLHPETLIPLNKELEKQGLSVSLTEGNGQIFFIFGTGHRDEKSWCFDTELARSPMIPFSAYQVGWKGRVIVRGQDSRRKVFQVISEGFNDSSSIEIEKMIKKANVPFEEMKKLDKYLLSLYGINNLSDTKDKSKIDAMAEESMILSRLHEFGHWSSADSISPLVWQFAPYDTGAITGMMEIVADCAKDGPIRVLSRQALKNPDEKAKSFRMLILYLNQMHTKRMEAEFCASQGSIMPDPYQHEVETIAAIIENCWQKEIDWNKLNRITESFFHIISKELTCTIPSHLLKKRNNLLYLPETNIKKALSGLNEDQSYLNDFAKWFFTQDPKNQEKYVLNFMQDGKYEKARKTEEHYKIKLLELMGVKSPGNEILIYDSPKTPGIIINYSLNYYIDKLMRGRKL